MKPNWWGCGSLDILRDYVYLYYSEFYLNDPHLSSIGLNSLNNGTWISDYNDYKVWDKITYPFLNFNGTTVEV